MQRDSAIILGACAALGLIIGATAIAYGIRSVALSNRVVSVRGLVEREVRSDLAVWALKTRVAGNDLQAAQAEIEKNTQTIKAFLLAGGLAENEVELKSIRVVDKKAQEYGGAVDAASFRYIIDALVMVRTSKVDTLEKLAAKLGDLLKSGVALADDNNCNPGPQYSYTLLNDIKPEMLKQATLNAREAAQQFAENSGSHVGELKTASQGVFSITPRDAVSEGGEGGACLPSDPNKKVRVVTTLEYYLK